MRGKYRKEDVRHFRRTVASNQKKNRFFRLAEQMPLASKFSHLHIGPAHPHLQYQGLVTVAPLWWNKGELVKKQQWFITKKNHTDKDFSEIDLFWIYRWYGISGALGSLDHRVCWESDVRHEERLSYVHNIGTGEREIQGQATTWKISKREGRERLVWW